MRSQAKYDPLQAYLKSLGLDRIRMTFDEIEQVIGRKLPASARKHRAWWSNNPSNSVITYAWLKAGYKTKYVSMEDEFLTFCKDISGKRFFRSPAEGKKSMKEHPVFACMSETVITPTDTDLTEPGLPDWAAITESQAICNE